jgi:hypothetical protein
LDRVVRAAWEVKDIRPVGHVISSNGSPSASKAFIAELKCGNATCAVSVDVTLAAIDLLRGRQSKISHSIERAVPANELAAVQRYLERQLSLVGPKLLESLERWTP